MSSTPQGIRGPSVEATIEQIRYWVPTVADVARAVEARESDSWLLSIEPHLATACPVAVVLRQDGQFDISIAGETYEDCTLESLDRLVIMLERITDGHVVQRRWISAATVRKTPITGPTAISRKTTSGCGPTNGTCRAG